MTTLIHLLLGLAIVATIPLAPALTLPAIGAWLLLAWVGRTIDELATVAVMESNATGCGCTMALILLVGAAALLLLLVGGAALVRTS